MKVSLISWPVAGHRLPQRQNLMKKSSFRSGLMLVTRPVMVDAGSQTRSGWSQSGSSFKLTLFPIQLFCSKFLCCAFHKVITKANNNKEDSGALINKAHNTELVRCQLVLTKAKEMFAKEEEKTIEKGWSVGKLTEVGPTGIPQHIQLKGIPRWMCVFKCVRSVLPKEAVLCARDPMALFPSFLLLDDVLA